MPDNHQFRRAGRRQGVRRRGFIQPPFDTNNLRPDELMSELTIMLAHGNEMTVPFLFSRDFPHGFFHAWYAEGTGFPITELVRSYMTPFGAIHCTRAINLFVKPAGADRFVLVQLSLLETETYPYGNLPAIFGQPFVDYFYGTSWPYINVIQPLVHLDFSPRQSTTFPGPAVHDPMAAAGSFTNNASTWPAPSQLQVGFAQAGDTITFAATAATTDELSREDQTRIWVEENGSPSQDVVDG
ncbi:uncharacterized protein B0H64DRAFT_373424 [Chaetomium fimeti]|uniref:Uncharacterized protein n=1 Tax=Chaetomium fimeti TaxID=1854472 RepID=A0AAE0LSG4_9PEZI|nr:hypothetical protein B0H64DRAFT_373424 [Chaetomium fimeti]